MLNQSVTLSDLDRGVQECVMAKTVCRGLEISETHTEGWRFNGLVLIKDDVVVYKLTGGWL